jgi:hypothetical protein
VGWSSLLTPHIFQTLGFSFSPHLESSVMELHQLEYFVAVVEELYFGQVAARLRMTQPSLSRQIMLVGGEVTLLDHEVVG